jgi:crotonobetainyl-CoA:carnitine CoA-transferase CaiB-like acyl-CoA transferase
MNFLVSGKTPRRTGNAHPNIQPQDVFACRDGQIALAVGNDGQFAKLCEVLGKPDLARDERFAKNAPRVRNLAVLHPLIAGLLKERDRSHWVAALDTAGVPAGPINSVPEVFEDPQVKHRRMLIDVAHPLSGTVPQVASPMRFTAAPLVQDRAPPLLGEHTVDILRDIGIGDAEIERLKAGGAV